MNSHTHRSLIFTAAQRLTLGLDEVPLLGAGLAVAVTADVIEGEEQMVLLVQLSRKLDLILKRRSTTQHFSSMMVFMTTLVSVQILTWVPQG